jgi:hypothetical protein
MVVLVVLISLTVISMMFLPSSASTHDSLDGYEDIGYSYYDYASAAQTFLHAVLSTPIRSITIACLIFSCCSSSNKDFALLNRFLSKRPFVMISRLSYAYCLTHLIPIMIRSYDITQVQVWSTSTFLSNSIVNLFYGLLLALIVNTCVEQPIKSLDKAIRQRIEHNEVTKLRSLRPSNNLAPSNNRPMSLSMTPVAWSSYWIYLLVHWLHKLTQLWL